MSDAPAPAAPVAGSPMSEAPSATTEAPQAESQEKPNTQESKESSSESPKAEGEKKETPKAPKYRKIKVGDEEISLSDEDIARDYKKWKGADAKFREAAEARTASEKFMEEFVKDPAKMLADKRLPFDKRALAEKWMMEQLESELNPPDPRDQKLTEAERRLKEYEDRDNEQAQTKEQEETKKFVESRKTAIGETIQKAMQSTHLSANPETAAATMREMAVYMRAAKEAGEDVSPDELVKHIHNSRFQQFYTLANQFEGDDLIGFLGESVVKKLRQADLARLKKGREPKQHKSDSWANAESSKPAKRMDAYEAREMARKKLGL